MAVRRFRPRWRTRRGDVYAPRHPKLNDINPQAWLADVLARIVDQPASRLDELLPWLWKAMQDQAVAARSLPRRDPRRMLTHYAYQGSRSA